VNKLPLHAGKRRPLFAASLLRILLFVGVSSVAVAVRAADPASTITLEGTVLVQVEDDFEHEPSRTRYRLAARDVSTGLLVRRG
jgi:hypothetical protein